MTPATPTANQAKAMQRAGISFPFIWLVVETGAGYFRVKNTITREVIAIATDPKPL